MTILDVRRDDEFQESHLPKAVNIPVHELSGRLNELPAGEVWCIAPAGTGHPSQRRFCGGSGRRRVHYRRDARVDALAWLDPAKPDFESSLWWSVRMCLVRRRVLL